MACIRPFETFEKPLCDLIVGGGQLHLDAQSQYAFPEIGSAAQLGERVERGDSRQRGR